MKTIRGRRQLLAALAVAGATLVSASAWAKERVALLPLQGPGAEGLEKILGQVLPTYVELIPLPEVDRAIAKQGASLPVSAQQHKTLARQLRAAAVVGGRIANGSPTSWRMTLTVREGTTGQTLSTLDFAGKSRYALAINVRRRAPPSLRDALAARGQAADPLLAGAPSPLASEPAAAEPERPEPADDRPEPEPRRKKASARAAEESEDEEEPPPRRGGKQGAEAEVAEAAGPSAKTLPPVLEVSLGPKVMSRAFIYTDNLAGLPGYTLPAAVGVAADAELYPAARSKSAARNFGLAGLWEASMGARTLGRDGKPITTRNNIYRVGTRYRVQWPSFVLTLGGDYGVHRFDALIEDAIAPNVVYSFLRPSIGFRAVLGSGVSLGLTAAYLHILAVDDLGDQDRFPRLRAKGAEANFLIGYALDQDFDIRLQADLRHYAHDMNVKPGDPLPVGGAVDEHFGASLLIRYLLR